MSLTTAEISGVRSRVLESGAVSPSPQGRTWQQRALPDDPLPEGSVQQETRPYQEEDRASAEQSER